MRLLGSDTTYKELKPGKHLQGLLLQGCSDTTYKELKLFRLCEWPDGVYCSDTTYKELKHEFYNFYLCAQEVFRYYL